MSENGMTSMRRFAAEVGVHRITISDLVRLHKLPVERMSNGRAKGLSRKTQQKLRKILGIKACRVAA